MSCNFLSARALGFGGLLILLAACESNADAGGGVDGGAAGAGRTNDTGGRTSSGGTGTAGSSAVGGTSEAGTKDGGMSGGTGEPSFEAGGEGGADFAAGSGGASAGTAAASGGTTNHGGHAGNAGGAAPSELMIPCDVYAAYRVCRNCHIDPPIGGAPMPLVTLPDLQTFADSAYQAVLLGTMPATGSLSTKEAALILSWLGAGAQGVPLEACPAREDDDEQ